MGRSSPGPQRPRYGRILLGLEQQGVSLAPGVATKVIGASCGLTAFAVGVLAGLFADNPPQTILLRAIVALFVGQVVGFIIGAIGERTVGEALSRYQKK